MSLDHYRYEPKKIEIFTTEILNETLLSPYYKQYINSLSLSEDDKLLDFCCGNGSLAKVVKKHHPKVVIFYSDISKRWINLAKIKLKRFANTTKLNFELLLNERITKFDKILVHFVIHDFPKELQIEVIDLLAANCRKDGLIYLREPINKKHGIELYELINLLELNGKFDYTYTKKNVPLIGKEIDVVCQKR